ncbi:MAG: dockerin type I repeat-containing protein [Pirellulales bacterium]|nr:dockerin type I repeat-containing protein [Pirellulales bacterium]
MSCQPLKFLCLAAMAVVWSAQSACATPTEIKDSADFFYKYEMDVNPSDKDLIDLDANGDPDLYVDNSGGTVTFDGVATLSGTSSMGSPDGYTGTTWATSNIFLEDGYTIEARIKVISDTGGDPIFGMTANPGSTANAWFMAGAGGQQWSIGGGKVPFAAADNTDDFHVFRITQDPTTDAAAPIYSAWRDGVLLSGTLTSAFPNLLWRMHVGGMTGGSVGTTELDYLRFAKGAFAPPEVTQPHPGDFNGDGNVDGADFVAWQTHFPTASGASLADGDANGDGAVDGADFVIWQTSFPFPLGPGVSSVPEPAAWILGCLSIPMLLALRKRRA